MMLLVLPKRSSRWKWQHKKVFCRNKYLQSENRTKTVYSLAEKWYHKETKDKETRYKFIILVINPIVSSNGILLKNIYDYMLWTLKVHCKSNSSDSGDISFMEHLKRWWTAQLGRSPTRNSREIRAYLCTAHYLITVPCIFSMV